MPGTRGLPFGRPPGQPPQNQFLDGRSRAAPEEIDEWVSCVNPYLFGDTSTLVANRLSFMVVPQLMRDVRVDTVRIRVNTAAAGTHAAVAVYARDGDNLRLISGSEVNFSTIATGVLERVLPASLVLRKDARYYMAFRADNATPSFSAFSGGSNGMWDRLYTSWTSSALPKLVARKDLLVQQGQLTGVVYYAAGVIQ